MSEYQLRRQSTISQQNPATNEIQDRLLKIFNKGDEIEFKKEALALISSNKVYFRVLDLHGDAAQQELTKEEFVKHFSFCFKREFSEALFKVMADGHKTASVVNLQFQFQGRRRTTIRQKEVVKDAEWLMHKLKNLDLKDIDDNEDLKIERQELRDYFKDELDEALVDQIFDAIDRDKSGSITPMEYFQWKGKAKLGAIKTIIKQAEAARGGNPSTKVRFIEEEEEQQEQEQEDASKNQMSEEIKRQQQQESKITVSNADNTAHQQHPSVALAAEQKKVANMEEKNLRAVTFEHEPHPSQYVLSDAQVTQKGIDFWENHNKHSTVNEDWWKMQLAERQKLKQKQKHISQQSLYGNHSKVDTIAGLNATNMAIEQLDDTSYDDIEPSVIIHGVAETPNANTTVIRPNFGYDFEESQTIKDSDRDADRRDGYKDKDKDKDRDKDKDKTTTITTISGPAPSGFQIEYQKLLEDYREANDLLLQSEQEKENRMQQLKTREETIEQQQSQIKSLQTKVNNLEKQLETSNINAEQTLHDFNTLRKQNETIKQDLEKELSVKLSDSLRQTITQEITENLSKQQQIANQLMQSQWDQQLQALQKQWELTKNSEFQLFKQQLEQDKLKELETQKHQTDDIILQLKQQLEQQQNRLHSKSNTDADSNVNANVNSSSNSDSNSNSNSDAQQKKELEQQQLQMNIEKAHLQQIAEQQRKFENELLKLNQTLIEERKFSKTLSNDQLSLQKQLLQSQQDNDTLKRQLTEKAQNNNKSNYDGNTVNTDTITNTTTTTNISNQYTSDIDETKPLLANNSQDNGNGSKRTPRNSQSFANRVETDSGQSWCCGIVCCSATFGISCNDKNNNKE